jgi:hypothetical protein
MIWTEACSNAAILKHLGGVNFQSRPALSNAQQSRKLQTETIDATMCNGADFFFTFTGERFQEY